MTIPHLAVVPVRSFTNAKERLRDVLSDHQRHILVRRMAEVVVRTVAEMMPVLVVSGDPEVLAWASALGAEPLPEPAGPPPPAQVRRYDFDALLDEGLNYAVSEGAAAASHMGARTLLVIAADLPLLSHDDVTAVLRLPSRPGLTLAADKHGYGTNALAVSPPHALRFRFGAESLAQHRLTANRSGIPVRVVHRAGLATDIDTPDDLGWLPQNFVGAYAPRLDVTGNMLR
ncbi:MAG: 2-phospho-L-lactate guanylyltransferase [Actinobacteria bacterium ATB1]|nr:2-phospho-L-lactate guanylyltransferase [Actinobacteria bacterium ATB1]